jgi:UDP-GlcNAc:undecaprenyl-phosphate GlcNAc-1-phosphate transferase
VWRSLFAGALLGFLIYNLPPATIFLGDSGSILIGLVVGVLAIQSALKGPATVALAAPLAILTIPIFDAAAAIARRKLTGRSVYTTDRGHLHHCLLRRGLSGRGVLVVVSVLCLLTVAGALVSLCLNNEVFALISAVLTVGILIVGRLFGYAEFLLVRGRLAMLAASFLRRRPSDTARVTEVRLQGSVNWQDFWRDLTEYACQLNFGAIQLDVNAPAIHEGYHARWQRLCEESENPGVWRAEIPLTLGGQTVGRVEVIGQRDGQPVWLKIAALTRLTDGLDARVAALIPDKEQATPVQPRVAYRLGINGVRVG